MQHKTTSRSKGSCPHVPAHRCTRTRPHTPTHTHTHSSHTHKKWLWLQQRGKRHECGAVANHFTAADGAKAKSRKMKLVRFGSSYIGSTSTRAREHEHEREYSSTRTLTNTRALEHDHKSTRARARARGGQAISAPSAERHAKPVGQFFNRVGLHAPGWL